MSYYDRLQGQLNQAQASGADHLNQLNQVKEKAGDAFSQAVGDVGGLASLQMDEFMKIGAKHYAEHTGIKLLSKHVVAPMKTKFAEKQMDALSGGSVENPAIQTRLGGLGREADEIGLRGEQRLGKDATGAVDNSNVQDAYQLDSGEIIGENHPWRSLRDDAEPMEGKVVSKDIRYTHADDVMDANTGLKGVESERLGEIADSSKAIGGEEVGGLMGKLSKIGDFLGPVGEIAQLGIAVTEGIKNAIEGHKKQQADIGTESSAIQSGAQASMYSGMNRPSFGSMALPSFDTSKSSVMLQQ